MGKCPHCGSKNIRKRYREHRRYKWRCRNCNQTFRRPKRGIVLWLVVIVIVVAAALFAAQQGIKVLPTALAPSGELAGGLAEVVMPTATPGVPAAQTPARVAARAETPMDTPTAMPTPTVRPADTRVPPTHLRHLDAKQYMLDLINTEREKAGVSPVMLGDNIAAQLHAEAALANCFASHWGVDGLKPYMRYSLAGGYQSNGENGHGSDYCITSGDRYKAIDSVLLEIDDAIDGWMSSLGHRRNILDKHHKKVNIGIAWDDYNFLAYQHFEGDYVEYDKLPAIENGQISLNGIVKNGVQLGDERDLGVQIYYDPPPHELTRGQVSRTYCYDGGRKVASLREPLTGGQYWNEDEFSTIYQPCPDPYDVPQDAPPARSNDEAHDLWEEAYTVSRDREEQTIIVPWITGLEWEVRDKSFSVEADINEVLEEHREGVYTVVVWGNIDGERAVISEYSIFHGVTPPDTYTPR